jgi:putative transposase
MPKRINIAKGQRIRVREREYEFFNAVPSKDGTIDAPHDLQFRDVQDHRIEVFTQAEFDRLYNAGQVIWQTASARAYQSAPTEPCEDGDGCAGCHHCSGLQRDRALQGLLKTFDADPVSKTDKALQKFLDAQEINWPIGIGAMPKAGKFRRMLRNCGDAGDRRLIYIGDRRPKGARKPRIHPAAEEVLWEKAEVYWTDKQKSASDIHASVVTALNAKNLDRVAQGLSAIPIPGRTTVWRMLTRHSDYDKTRMRLGARMAQRAFKPLKGKLEAKRILDVAVMDHTVLDCFVIDDEHHIPVGRPYLTFIIDVRSRYPLAYLLSFTPPSVETAMACVRRAVRPKDDLNARHPDVAPWQVFGVPRTILVDNAWEFTGRSFKDACEDAGISVEWAPVKTPEYKGIVERFNGVFNTQFAHKLKGAVPFKPHKLAEYGIDPQADAVLLLSEIDELIHQYIVEVYGRNFHTGIKAVPEQVWRERQAIDGIDYVADLPGLDMALSKIAGTRTLDRKGIDFQNLNYSSHVVFDLLNRLLPRAPKRGQARNSIKVKVKYWPEDMSKIAIWNPVDAKYVEIPCTSRLYSEGLSEHHHQVLDRYAKSQGLAFSTEAQRCAAKVRLGERIASFVNDRLIGTRRRAQRIRSDIPTGQVVRTVPHGDSHVEIDPIANRVRGEDVFKSKRKAAQKSGNVKAGGHPTDPQVQKVREREDVSIPTDVFEAYDRTALLDRFRGKGGH